MTPTHPHQPTTTTPKNTHPWTFWVRVVSVVSCDCSRACFSISATCCGHFVDFGEKKREWAPPSCVITHVHIHTTTSTPPTTPHLLALEGGRGDLHAEDDVADLRLRQGRHLLMMLLMLVLGGWGGEGGEARRGWAGPDQDRSNITKPNQTKPGRQAVVILSLCYK